MQVWSFRTLQLTQTAPRAGFGQIKLWPKHQRNPLWQTVRFRTEDLRLHFPGIRFAIVVRSLRTYFDATRVNGLITKLQVSHYVMQAVFPIYIININLLATAVAFQQRPLFKVDKNLSI